MKKYLGLTAVICALVSATCGLADAPLRLASDGRTEYAIVKPDRPFPDDPAAVADLAHYLKRITGAEFPVISSDEIGKRPGVSRYLYVGRCPDSDKKPLAVWERRVRSEDGNIYFYGYGERGGSGAVYDFLEVYFGCRWFSFRGDEKIPTNREPEFPAIDFSRVPSFPIQMYCSFQKHAFAQGKDFERRNRIYIFSRSIPMLITGHVPDMMVPPGGKLKNQLWKPFPLFAKEEWFEKHPEYFSQDPKGERVAGVQLCYSNPELRKLLNSKYEQIIKRFHKGGPALVKCNLNDNWGFSARTICCCPECMKLVAKYHDPAGPYWDYLIELCGFLKARYPEIIVEGSTYQITEKVPDCIGRLPDNLMVGYAPLWRNFLKSFAHPSNARTLERLKLSLEKFPQVRVQIYPTVYPRDTTIQPLAAGLRQWGETMRLLKKLGVVELTAELGYGWQSETAFSDLRHYLIARLANDVELDVDQLIEEYMVHTYAEAAPRMIAYWRELEKCEAEEENGMLWTGLPYGAFKYLTADNLARWSREFDAMEKLTAHDPAALAAVKSARANLDEAILSVWPRLPKRPEFELKTVLARARKNLTAAYEHAVAFEPDAKKRKEIFDFYYNRRVFNGIDFFAFAARTPHPLKMKRPLRRGAVHRQIPTHRRHTEFGQRAYSDDPKAAFGVSMWFSLKGKDIIAAPKIRRGDLSGFDEFIALRDPRPIQVSEMSKNLGKGYKLYYIGRTRLWPECVLWLGGLRRSMNAQLSHFYDRRHPEQEYDVYLSLRYRNKPVSANIAEVVLIKCDAHSPRPASGTAAAEKSVEKQR